MRKTKIALGAIGLLALAATAGWFALDKEVRGVLAHPPLSTDIFAWSEPQRDAGFRALDRLSLVAKSRVVAPAPAPRPLPPGPPLALPQAFDLDAYMAGQRGSALLVVHDGRLRLERYGLDFDAGGRWTSFSVAKSVTSMLVGAALKDGAIGSMDDPVTSQVPELRGSAYDAVTIRQLLTMTSGVQWSEDYGDPASDVVRFNKHRPVDAGVDALVDYMRRLPRAAPAGTRFNYSTGETNLVGVLVANAVKKPLSTYLSEKIWIPAGMEQQATWILSRTGREISGCCIQAAPRDWARFGLFVLEELDRSRRAEPSALLPAGWLAEATSTRAEIGVPERGYGYQWWTNADGTFMARGIFGQSLFLDPLRKLVIVSNGNWAGGARDPAAARERDAMFRTVQRAVE